MVSRPIVQLMTRNNVEHSFVFSRNIFWLKLTQMIFYIGIFTETCRVGGEDIVGTPGGHTILLAGARNHSEVRHLYVEESAVSDFVFFLAPFSNRPRLPLRGLF